MTYLHTTTIDMYSLNEIKQNVYIHYNGNYMLEINLFKKILTKIFGVSRMNGAFNFHSNDSQAGQVEGLFSLREMPFFSDKIVMTMGLSVMSSPYFYYHAHFNHNIPSYS